MKSSILKGAIAETEENIAKLDEENPYHISKEGYTVGTSEIYAQYSNNKTYYLKLGRKDEKNFNFMWCEQTDEETFKSLAPVISKTKSIIEDDESRTKKLIQQGIKKGIDKDKEQIEGFLNTIAIE